MRRKQADKRSAVEPTEKAQPLPADVPSAPTDATLRIDPAENCPVVHANMIFLGHRRRGRWRIVFF